MKKIAFVSRRKMVAQGLEAALAARPELHMELLPLIPPQNARTDISVYRPDVIILDVPRELGQDALFGLCRELRKTLPSCRLLLLLSEDEEPYHTLTVDAKRSGAADDFVFYDNSMNYLLAKLAAL